MLTLAKCTQTNIDTPLSAHLADYGVPHTKFGGGACGTRYYPPFK